MKYFYGILLALFMAIPAVAQQTVGLFVNDSLAYNGYTLLAPNSSRNTYLIDNCGEVVNQWESDYIPYFSAYLDKTGHLLRAVRFGTAGGGIEKHDWEGNLVWQYRFYGDNFSQHHDIEPLPNGNILVLSSDIYDRTSVITSGRDSTLVDDALLLEAIFEIKPIGFDSMEIVWEWRAFDHLVQDFDATKKNFGNPAEHPELLDFNFIGIGGSYYDWLHANHIDYHPELDQIILNSRNFNEFWVIDHSTNTEEASGHSGGNSGKGGDILYRWGNPIAYGRGDTSDRVFYYQHNANWVDTGSPGEGNIVVFNNGLERMPVEYSSVDVLVPPVDAFGNYTLPPDNEAFAPADLTSTFTLFPLGEMFSGRISSAQRLPNGHNLICVGQTGRIFEADDSGNVYWDYITPIQGNNPVTQGTPIGGNSVFKAERYAPDFEGFVGKDLKPGSVIELNPLVSSCEIITDIASPSANVELAAFPNPAIDNVTFTVHFSEKIKNTALEIYDTKGRLLQHIDISPNTDRYEMNIENWTSGVYFYRIRSDAGFSATHKLTIIK